MVHEGDDTDDQETAGSATAPESNSSTLRTDWRSSAHPSVSVVEAVAAATNQRTDELPPLQESVDADALDDLLGAEATSQVVVSFQYAGTSVFLTGAGTLEVEADGLR